MSISILQASTPQLSIIPTVEDMIEKRISKVLKHSYGNGFELQGVQLLYTSRVIFLSFYNMYDRVASRNDLLTFVDNIGNEWISVEKSNEGCHSILIDFTDIVDCKDASLHKRVCESLFKRFKIAYISLNH
jgi:hypothetical protein